MNIQILGIREYLDKRDNKTKKKEAFFERGWRAPSVQEILANADVYLKDVPQEERYNLYFTTAECVEERGRKLLVQRVIPFDIDKIDRERAQEVYFTACEALGFIPEQVGAVFSGNGVWLFLNAAVPIEDEAFFDENRMFYKELCHKINTKLKSRDLAGSADPTCFSAARLARMPETTNRKPGKEEVKAYTLNANISAVLDLREASGLPVLGKEDSLDKNFMKAYPSPDAHEILSERGCSFLRECKSEPNKVTEEQWYAMLGILEWLPEGRALSHEFSRGYKGYSFEETERKAEQAKTSAGPRTCHNINQIWSKCGNCPHFNKIKSPVQIRGKEFIPTEKTGFWSYRQTKEGAVILDKPQVMDLVKFFKRKHTFVSVPETRELFLYNGTHWQEIHTSYLEKYAKDHFNPPVPTYQYEEFKKNVLLTNTVEREWFYRTTEGKFNMQNGVYDMNTGELKPHDSGYGFTYQLPYSYDPHADAPLFKKFLDDVTLGKEDLKVLLTEFAGYCLSNDDCWLQKALFLTGDGANGKSTFAEVLRKLAGDKNCASQRIERIGKPIANAHIENKLFNISEESSAGAFFDSQDFKEVVGGGHINIKRLYKNEYSIPNRTKFIVLCNELPKASDATYGFFRRLAIVPFNATFTAATRDPEIVKKLEKELSGIFNLVVSKYKEVKARGRLYDSRAAEIALDVYQQESNVIGAWAAEQFIIDEGAPKEKWISMTDIYQEYVQNCQYDWGVKSVSAAQFWKRFSKGLKTDHIERRRNVKRNGKQMWVLAGIVRKEITSDEF